jgi:hypothetical protein
MQRRRLLGLLAILIFLMACTYGWYAFLQGRNYSYTGFTTDSGSIYVLYKSHRVPEHDVANNALTEVDFALSELSKSAYSIDPDFVWERVARAHSDMCGALVPVATGISPDELLADTSRITDTPYIVYEVYGDFDRNEMCQALQFSHENTGVRNHPITRQGWDEIADTLIQSQKEIIKFKLIRYVN